MFSPTLCVAVKYRKKGEPNVQAASSLYISDSIAESVVSNSFSAALGNRRGEQENLMYCTGCQFFISDSIAESVVSNSFLNRRTVT